MKIGENYTITKINYGKPIGTKGIIESFESGKIWFRTSDSHRMLIPLDAIQ